MLPGHMLKMYAMHNFKYFFLLGYPNAIQQKCVATLRWCRFSEWIFAMPPLIQIYYRYSIDTSNILRHSCIKLVYSLGSTFYFQNKKLSIKWIWLSPGWLGVCKSYRNSFGVTRTFGLCWAFLFLFCNQHNDITKLINPFLSIWGR